MTELKCFRLMLVVVATLLLSLGSGWAWVSTKERAAEQAVSTSFGDYNRYVEACGGRQDGPEWDLAKRAYETLARATAARERYGDLADNLLWVALIVCPALVVGFYAFRWALTGRVRPLWLLGRGGAAKPPAA
jgi:hypothetical protein